MFGRLNVHESGQFFRVLVKNILEVPFLVFFSAVKIYTLKVLILLVADLISTLTSVIYSRW